MTTQMDVSMSNSVLVAKLRCDTPTAHPPHNTTSQLLLDINSKKASDKDLLSDSLSQASMAEYVQQVAIILGVQVFIPIPFMLPLGINFTKRAMKVLFLGSLIGVIGHVILHGIYIMASKDLGGPVSFIAFPGAGEISAVALAHLKLCVVGGFAIGAAMAHILNVFVLGHTLCRFARGLEPDPAAMRHALDASKGSRYVQNAVLDLATGVFMVPAGVAAIAWWHKLWNSEVTHLGIDKVHTTMIGVAGSILAQVILWMWARRP